MQWLWASWEVRDRDLWLFQDFILFLSGPIGLYMAAAVLFPRADSLNTLDEHFLQRRLPFFSLLVLVNLSYVLSDRLVVEGRFTSQDVVRAIGIGLFTWLAVRRRPWSVGAVALALQLELRTTKLRRSRTA